MRDNEFSSILNHSISYSGFTPLHYAVIVDDEYIVKYLLENGILVTCDHCMKHN